MYLGRVAVRWVRDELLPGDLGKMCPDPRAALEIPDKRGEIPKSSEGKLVPSGSLWALGHVLLPVSNLGQHPNPLLTQELEKQEYKYLCSLGKSGFIYLERG